MLNHPCERCEQLELDPQVYETIAMCLDFVAKSLWGTGAVEQYSLEVKQIAEARRWIAQLGANELDKELLEALINKLN